MFAAGLAVAAVDLLSPAVYGVLSWAGLPLLGAASPIARRAAGLLNYAAWIAPPVCAGRVALAAVRAIRPRRRRCCCARWVSLVGAAAGEVQNQRSPRN